MTAAILAGLLLAGSVPQPRFGIAVAAPGGALLALEGPALRAGAAVTLVVPGPPQVVHRARVKGAVASCEPCRRADVPGPYYRLEGVAGLDAETVAVVGEPPARVTDDVVRLDLGADAPEATVRACTSTEGVHLTVWSGRPLASARLWHAYWYLNMDVEPSCTEQDTREPLTGR